MVSQKQMATGLSVKNGNFCRKRKIFPAGGLVGMGMMLVRVNIENYHAKSIEECG